MALLQPHQMTRQEPTVVAATADPEVAQRAEEAHAGLILMACLVALVVGTQLLVALLGQLA